MSEASDEKRSRIRLSPETLLSSLVLVLVVNLLQRSIGFGRAVLFCRWLEPEQLGYWEMAFSFLLLAAPLAVLGLPGSFGRYLEKYRQQGSLQLFLRRTTTWTFVLASLTLALMFWRRSDMASLVFGDSQQQELVTWLIACLAVVILHHFLEAVFAGLRMFRVVSAMHFTQSMVFAAVSLSLLCWWRSSGLSILLGYGIACLVSVAGVLTWSALRLERSFEAKGSITHREFWPPLMQFAIWVWLTNLLSNVFGVIDRYMILHLGVFDAEQALVQVGNYHTSNLIPVLIISFANILVGAMTPHLSHDWEAGRKNSVSNRVNLTLKLASLAMVGGSVFSLVVGPALFDVAFGDKYAAGLAVMPWTLASCVWFSLLLVAQQYVWCAEKSHRACLPLSIGLLANVALNLLLLPTFGLLGAVAATGLSTLLGLLLQLLVNHRTGMRVHHGTLLMMFAPILLVFGPAVASIGISMLLLLAIARGWVLTAGERRQMADLTRAWRTRFLSRFGRVA